MGNRSLRASPRGIIQARQAFTSKKWTQERLAVEIGIKTRQPIGRFFTGKPVERQIFKAICFHLGLNWQHIAEFANPDRDDLSSNDRVNAMQSGQSSTNTLAESTLPNSTIQEGQNSPINLNDLVEKARSLCHDKIQHQCGRLRLLDVPQPLNLDDIYVEVNILEKILARRWLEISDLQQLNSKEFDRISLGAVQEERASVLEAVAKYPKLMVLGKPGSGKTTFLQYLAFHCNQGDLQPDRVPILIHLKDFVEDTINGKNPFKSSLAKRELSPRLSLLRREKKEIGSLVEYISQEFGICGVSQAEVETLLRNGKLLILLDGLDEVPRKYSTPVLQKIRRLSQKYYKNSFAIASRTASYSYKFEGFTEVEIADFNQQQIEAFAKKFFVATAKNDPEEGLAKASYFIEKLGLPENLPIRELTATPLLLKLTCLVFDATDTFPSKRYKLYEEGLNILLVRWDATKGIERDEFYHNLSLADKIKLLCFIAILTFEEGNYFLEQSKIQEYIANYLRLLPDAETDQEALRLGSEAVLKSMEVQHGLLIERSRKIYSFSHLTFQEYFTARTIVNAGVPAWQQLMSHITEKHWREVFLIATGLLRTADPLLQLMKQKIDAILVEEVKLQQFLKWIDEKSQLFQLKGKPASSRAFFLSLALALDHYLEFGIRVSEFGLRLTTIPYFPLPFFLSLATKLDPNVTFTSNLGLRMNSVLKVNEPNYTLDPSLKRVYLLDQVLSLALHFDLVLIHDLAWELQSSLQELKDQLPEAPGNSEKFQRWWQANRLVWSEQLKVLRLRYQKNGLNWHFTNHQKQLLRHYYEANKLLIDCLNNGCEVSDEVRQQIEESLFLPIIER